MPREILQRVERDVHGVVQLVADPHDTVTGPGTGPGRWFVEAQIRFTSETQARAFFMLLRALAGQHGGR